MRRHWERLQGANYSKMKKFQDNCWLLFSQKYCDHEGLRKNFNFFLSPNECKMLFSHYFSIYKQIKNTSMFTSGIDKDLQVYQVYRTHACVHVHMRVRNPKQKCIFDLRTNKAWIIIKELTNTRYSFILSICTAKKLRLI